MNNCRYGNRFTTWNFIIKIWKIGDYNFVHYYILKIISIFNLYRPSKARENSRIYFQFCGISRPIRLKKLHARLSYEPKGLWAGFYPYSLLIILSYMVFSSQLFAVSSHLSHYPSILSSPFSSKNGCFWSICISLLPRLSVFLYYCIII